MITKLIISNFRSLRHRQVIPISPLTILVGENSTGKSALLAATRIAFDILTEPNGINFNEAPFRLGAYGQIVSNTRGRNGTAQNFSIGCEVRVTKPGRREYFTAVVEAVFKERSGHPSLCQWSLDAHQYRICLIAVESDQSEYKLRIQIGDQLFESSETLGGVLDIRDLAFFVRHFFWMKRVASVSNESSLEEDSVREITEIFDALDYTSFISGRPYAFDPIRTQPQRTYDFIQEASETSGKHIPVFLATTRFSPSKWARLSKQLSEFGRSSGLFSSLKVRAFEDKLGSPFQLHVEVPGGARNVVDVGYGVSQVLPILVDSISQEKERLFLIQQPEVHLHPRAQAALGTFLGQLAQKHNKRFIVETHSDYFIDRLRLDIRDGVISTPGDVGILFFEKDGPNTIISPIGVSAEGNVVGAPASYRQFFLEEEGRFFGL